MSNGSLLHNRRFLALWSGNAFSLIGTAGVRISYPLIVLAVADSPALAGWVAFALTLPSLLFQVPAGIAADKMNRRQLMLAASAVGLVATGVVILGSMAQIEGLFVVLLIAAFVEGSAYVVFSIAEVGAVRDVVNEKQRTAAFSFLEAEPPVANIVGRVSGGALFGVAQWLPFLLNLVSYAFSVVTLAFMPKRLFDPRPEDIADAAEERRGFWSRMGEGLRWTWDIPFLRLSSIVIGLTNLLFQSVILLVLVVSALEDRPAWTVGVILGAAGAGGVAGSVVAPWLEKRVAPRPLFVGCVWCWTVLLLAIALSKSTLVMAVAWAGVGAVGTMLAVILTVVRVRAVPDAAVGRVVGAATLISDGVYPLGALLAGYVLATAGPDTGAWLIFGVMALLAVYCTLFLQPFVPAAAAPSRGTEIRN